MDRDAILDVIREALVALNEAVDSFQTRIPEPVFAEVSEEDLRLRHLQFDSDLLIRLKTLRVLSGINAALVLYGKGYFQEVAVLIRVTRHSIDDILFMVYCQRNPSSERDGMEFMRGFYEHPVPSVEELRSGRFRKEGFVPRRKINAAISRVLKVPDPSTFLALQAAEDAALDGYVHPGYAQIMEMYSAPERRFQTTGSTEPSHAVSTLGFLANTMVFALNAFAVLAAEDQDKQLMSRLLARARALDPVTTIAI